MSTDSHYSHNDVNTIAEPQQKGNFDISKIDVQLRKWRERLLDLTKGNPLLGINRSRVSKLLIKEPDPAKLFTAIVVDEKTLKMPLVKRKTKRKKNAEIVTTEAEEDNEPVYTIEPGDIDFVADLKDIFRLQRRIYDNGRTTVEERGVTTLHLTFGILNWEDPILGESSSPLLLVPCQLENHGPSAHMRLKILDEELRINPALELYLRERHHVTLPSLLDDDQTADSLQKFLTHVQSSVKEQGWQVENKTWLSTFSFESLVLYADLGAMVDIAHINPIVAALSMAGMVHDGSEALGENLDELDTPNQVPIAVLPADASQLRALAIATSGHHLVIHGPPGTGKSQTIANLIADALGKGKKVLFVSAKMAALDVVHDRLTKLGLGRYCLEAHSTKAGKAKIIEELKKTLDLPIDDEPKLLGEQLEELKKVRINLNSYVKEIHQRHEPLGRTVYQVIGLIEKLHNLPDIEIDLPWADPLVVGREELRSKVEVLEELGSQADLFIGQEYHPWRGFSINPGEPLKQEYVKKNLQIVLEKFETIKNHLSALSGLLISAGLELTLSQLKDLVPLLSLFSRGGGLPVGWRAQNLEELKKYEIFFELASTKADELQVLRGVYYKITKLSPNNFKELLEPLNTKFLSRARVFNPSYWKWRKLIADQILPGAKNLYPNLREYSNMVDSLLEVENWFTLENKNLSEHVENATDNPQELKKKALEFAVAQEFRSLISLGILKEPEVIDCPTDCLGFAADIVEIIKNESLLSAIASLELRWPTGFVDRTRIEMASISSVIMRCKELLSSMLKMHEWAMLQTTLAKVKAAGLEKFVQELNKISVKQASEIFEKRFYNVWVNLLLDSSSVLREFTGQRRIEQVERFKELDTKIRASALKQIKYNAYDPARNVSSARGNFDNSEIGILRRELQRRKKIKPLRKLFAEIPTVLQAIKPCMLMSPISVSTFLKPGVIMFDLVVFDEASQLPSQEAIPSILRAKQVVVAGDENQLPPTSFFLASSIFEGEDNDWESDDPEQLESLLDDCVTARPLFEESKIVWHYRSKDERLIKFSNHYFYNNQLITFPSATTSKDGRGIHLVYTPDGVWDRGRSRTNRVEAKAVAETVIEQLIAFPERSVGVVAMNASQKEAIESAIDELIVSRPDLTPLFDVGKAEPFFVKSLENVQGDERDTMIISVGYAKTIDGSLSLNFGPLNREGGWRRLNVLVTRAKWQTILVTSIRSYELGAINLSNKGAIMLRNFIEYAEQDAKIPSDPTTLPNTETNDFEDSIAAALRENSLIIDEQVGASGYRIDLAVRDPRDKNRYVLAIECDGATYHSAKTARDRDMLRQEVLQSQGWKVYRVWSTDWFRDREQTLSNLLKNLEIALQRPISDSVQAPPIIESNYERGDLALAVLPKQNSKKSVETEVKRIYNPGVPYEKYEQPRKGNVKDLVNKSRWQFLTNTVARIVRYESPIHISLIVERLKEVYGVSRAGANIKKKADQAVHQAVIQNNFLNNKKMIYKNKERPGGFRIPAQGVLRSISEIPDEEIENAIFYLIEDQFGFSREHLPKAIMELFGLGRLRSESDDQVAKVADQMITQGKLKLNGYMLYLS